MPAVRGSFSSLLQGVSRQPEELRFDSQASEQVNMVSDTVRGLSKRPSSHIVKELTALNSNINVDVKSNDKWAVRYIGNTQYLIGINDDGYVRAYDAQTGEEITVDGDLGFTYKSNNPIDSIRLISVEDYLVILNTDKEVEMSSLQAGGTYHSSLHFTGAQWGTVLSIELEQDSTGDKQKFTVRMPSGVGRLVDSNGNPLSPPDPELDVSRLDPANIISRFEVEIQNWAYNALDTSPDSNALYVEDGFTVVNVSDGARGRFLRHVGSSVTDVKDLPAYTKNNRVVAIRPSASNKLGAYYVKFDTSTESWHETVKPGSNHIINFITLPRCLIEGVDANNNKILRLKAIGDTTFPEFPQIAKMGAGDTDTNPQPSFINNKIQDIAVFKGRLAILSNNSITTSSANDYWDFWYNSATQVTDADPIDVPVGSGMNERLEKLVIQGGDLLMLGDGAQFIMQGVDVLSPQTVSISKASDFNMDMSGEVLPHGGAIYYSTNGKGISKVFTLVDGSYANSRGSIELTEHIGDYLSPDDDTYTPTSFSMSDVDSSLFVTLRRKDSPNDTYGSDLFVYRTSNQGGKIVQKSWSRWNYQMGFGVVFSYVIKGVLYVLGVDNKSSSDSYKKPFLIKHYLHDTPVNTFGVDVSMDFISSLAVTASTPSGQPAIDPTRAYEGQVVINEDGELVAGPLTGVNGSSTLIPIPPDKLTDNYMLGMPIRSVYSPTTPIIRDEKGAIDTTGHLMLHRYRVFFGKVGKVTHEVTSRFSDPYSQTDEASTESIINLSLLSDKPYLMEGIIKVPVLRSTKDLQFSIVSDDYRPATIMNIEYEGQYNKRRTGGI